MLVVGIETVMVEVDGDDVRQRQLVHFRQRMARTMKDKRNQRQRLAKAQRNPRLHQPPLLFRRPFLTCLTPLRNQLPNLNLALIRLPVLAPQLAALPGNQFKNTNLVNRLRLE